MADEPFDVEPWRASLSELSMSLRVPPASTDALLWAAARSIESAELLLRAYEHVHMGNHHNSDPRDAVRDAVGSARAAVAAATHAAQGL
jgi:hypothetical protein